MVARWLKRVFASLAAPVLLFQCFANPAAAQDASRENPLDLVFYEAATGKARTLGEFTGKKTVLHFWATWCAPCIPELPQLMQFARSGEDKAQVIALSEDQPEKGDVPYGKLRPFIERHSLEDLPAYWDKNGALARAFRVSSLPVTVVLDANGNEIAREDGRVSWTQENTLRRMGLLEPVTR